MSLAKLQKHLEANRGVNFTQTLAKGKDVSDRLATNAIHWAAGREP